MITRRKLKVNFASFLMITIMLTGLSIKGDNESREDFTDYDELTSELQDIAATYPDITNLYDLGQSVQGRIIWGLKITDNPDIQENEVELRYCGAHHGDEYMSIELPLLFAWYLVQNYSIDSEITDYVDNREIWIIPLVNPDGRQMQQRRNANNVDLNRDYGYMWNGAGSSPSPFSQPETKVIREHALDNNIVLSYSYHSGGAEYVNYLWNYKPQPTPDEPWIMMISEAYGDLSGLIPINGFDWYQVTGDTNDFSYGCYGGIDTTIETLNDDISFEWDRNRDAMIYTLDIADMGLSGIVTDASTGNPIAATIWVEENYWPCYTDPQIGDYHKPLFEGDYNVHFRANGYEEQIKQITITDANASNILDAEMIPGDDYYAYQVTMCKYCNYSTNPSEGISALGPPDNVSASLGDSGMMVLDMGPTTPIQNGDDDDFTIYEADDEPEGYDVSVSNNWNGPWSSLGSAEGTASFDLGAVGLNEARFVKIEDDAKTSDTKDYPGFDLDAIQADDPFIAVHDILVSSLVIPSVVPHGETQTVSANVKNNGHFTETNITVDFLINSSVMDSINISSLLSMESIDMNFSWNPAIGTYLVAIESHPILDEYDLLNNNVNKTVTVIEEGTYIEDINQSVFNRGFPIRHAADGDWGGAQNFTPTINTLTSCEIYLRKFGTPEFDLAVQLREDHPQGLLFDSLTFTPVEVDSSWMWLNVDFVDVTVDSETDYFIVCPPAPSGVTTSFGYEWGYAFGNQYDDGAFWFTRDGGGLWRDLPTMYEFVFRTYGYS